MTPRLHTHPCQQCETPVACDGAFAENYDGFPTVICTAFHLPSGDLNPACVCESCASPASGDDEADDPDGSA